MTTKIQLNNPIQFSNPPKPKNGISENTELAAIFAFSCLSSFYSIPLALFGLGLYGGYKLASPSKQVAVLPSELPYHPKDLKMISKTDVESKLSRELARAKEHMDAQKPRDPSWLSFARLTQIATPYLIHSHTDATPETDIGIAHAQGARPTMEDTHIVDTGIFQIGPFKVPYELFGVIDGHGGDQTARFVSEHLASTIEKAIVKHGVLTSSGLTDSSIHKALQEAFLKLDAQIATQIGNRSGAAAVISLRIGAHLWTANLGDSRAILKVGSKVIQLSEDAKPDIPRFRKAIEKRGGRVENVHGVPRVNGNLALARAFGDKKLMGKEGYYVVSPHPKITKVDLKPFADQEIHLIQACDGIWDVATSLEVASIERENPKELARAIVAAALNAGSSDNCSVLIAQIKIPT